MANSTRIPSVSVKEVARRRAAGDEFILLDVREPSELEQANLGDGVELAPTRQLSWRDWMRYRTVCVPTKMQKSL